MSLNGSKSNPFIVGKIVTGEDFADRINLLKEMILEVNNFQNIIIHGPRRLGKSSLMKEVLRIVKKDNFGVIYIDLLRYDKIESICGHIFKELAGTIEKAVEFAKSVFTGVSLKVESSSMELSFTSEEDILLKVFTFLGKYSEKKNKIVIVFDEFQEFENIAPQSIKKLRSIIQEHKNISYIFSGSDSGLIEFFINSNHPFYKFGKIINLGKPDEDEIKKFLKNKFTSSNLIIKEPEIDQIISLSSNLPYFIQLIAHEIWVNLILANLIQVSKEIVISTFKDILERSNSEYEIIWSKLTTNHRKALKILTLTHKPFDSTYLRKFKIAQGSLQTSISSLEKNQFIWKIKDNIEFLDPLFEKWVNDRV